MGEIITLCPDRILGRNGKFKWTIDFYIQRNASLVFHRQSYVVRQLLSYFLCRCLRETCKVNRQADYSSFHYVQIIRSNDGLLVQ